MPILPGENLPGRLADTRRPGKASAFPTRVAVVEDDFHEGRHTQRDIGRGWRQLVDEVTEGPAESDQELVFGVALDFHVEPPSWFGA